MTRIYGALTVDQSSARDKVVLNIREHSNLDRVVVEAYDNDGKVTYFSAENADRPRLALAMLGEQTDRRIGYMDVEDTAADPRAADEELAFIAYRSLAALQLRKKRRGEIAAEAAVAAARADQEREDGISALVDKFREANLGTSAVISATKLYDTGVRAA